jgi:hypothetical protein
VRGEIAGAFRDKLGVSIVPGGQSYQRPYDSQFDRLPYPQGTRIPEFAKFSGDQGKSTREHIDQFLAQLGELADTEAFHVRLFLLSLTGTAFTWYATLPPNSILSWEDLEQKFHEHFFSGDYELDLVDLVALRQEKDESVSDYIRRFRDTRNRCFQIHLTDKQLAGKAFDALRYYLKEKLEGIEFFTLAQLHQRVLACESRSKELVKTVHHYVHIVELNQSSSDDEPKEVYTAKIVWPEQAKSSACSSLQSVQKKRQKEVKFTFNVVKCDKIFDELLKNGNIKIDYTVPLADELKRRAYCKRHNSFSLVTNDCNVFRRQIQSAINEGRLKLQEDTEPFPVNMIDFKGKRVLIRPSTADKDKDKEVIIGNAQEADGNNKISCRKVVAEKTPNGGETLKVTITTSGIGGQAQTRGHVREPILRITDGPVPRRGRSVTSPDGPEHSSRRSDNAKEPRRPRTFKPRRPEIGTWKTNTFKETGRLVKFSPTFDQLLSKYVKKKAGISDRPPKRPRLPTQERQQVRPIGPPHQSEKTGDHNVQLRTNVSAWTPPPPYPPMPYPYTYIPPAYLPNQMWGMPPYPFGMPQYPAWGAPKTSIFNRLTPPIQRPIESPSIWSASTGPARLLHNSASKAN